MKEKNKVTPSETEEEIEVVKEESKGHKIVSGIINAVLVFAIALAAMSTYVSYVSTSGSGVPSIFGLQIFSIQTESMYPVLSPGDLIFDVSIKDARDLKKGDIVTYWTVINGESVLNTHTIYEIYESGEYLLFATKGENNTVADPMTVHESKLVGKYTNFKIPGLGKVFDYLQTSTGFLIVVVIPVFIFFLYYLVQFFRVLFEYQNVKNRIKYEQERGRTEDLLAAQEKMMQEKKAQERAALEAELREKLKAELMASMAATIPEEEPAPIVQPSAEKTPVEQA